MGDKTRIEWTDATWNPVTGCSPASDGCKNCYASRMIGRNLPHMGHEGPFSSVQFHPERLDQPLRWKKPRRIFVGSMADLFHPDVEETWLRQIFRTMGLAHRHTFMILTKRPERMREMIQPLWNWSAWRTAEFVVRHRHGDDHRPLPNVCLGVTAENQKMADLRIPILLQTPAAKRFVSIEPCFGYVRLGRYLPMANCAPGRTSDVTLGLDWVILGGETGTGARQVDTDWVRSVRDDCDESGVPFFFKGIGTARMKKTDPNYMKIDGREWKQFPALARLEEG